MKFNLKNKIMLAVLVGGMLCMGQALADFTYKVDDGEEQSWDGTSNLIGTGTKLEVWGSGTTAAREIYGGKAFDASSVEGKKVFITSGNFSFTYGGFSSSGKVTNNEVTINDGWVANVFGGQSNSGGNATNNTVTINGGSVAGVYGGKSYSGGNATNNTVTINGGWVARVYGGYSSDTCNTTNNEVTINGGSVANSIYGGYTSEGSATGNKVTIEGDILADGTMLYGGYSESGAATGNSVTIDKGTFGKVIYGGSSNSGNAESNSITINGGTFGNGIYGGYSNSGNAESNSVTITDGTIKEHVFGGYTDGSGNVTKNTVTISGGNFVGNGHIYGGGYSGDGNATDNTLTIEGGTFTEGFSIYGGWTSGSKTSSGNILNLKTKIGGKATEVGYFQIMNFTLPADIAGGDTMLKTENMTFDPTNTVINVDASAAATLNDGDIITLIQADSTPTGNWTAGTVTGAEGTITLDGNNIIFTVTGTAGGGDKEKAPVEGVAAGVAMVNQSADLASGEGMTSLLANTAGGGTDTYGAVTAGRSKYQTGSHVDMDGWGVLIGAGTTKNWTSGDKTTYGLFFEYGKGDFDTYNNDIHGEGDSKNEGVGIMARHTLKNNTYFDANIRYGKQETEWSESEIGGYDTDSRYYGAAVGLGHVYPLENNDELDVYVRYSYGHVGASDAKVKDSDYHFDRVLSQRLRLGAKYNFVQKDNKAKPYVGMAWERELKGESRATITGIGEAPAPSLKGNTGIFEIGCDWDTGKWSLGAGANAYIGKRKGWDGMIRAFYNF